LTLNQGLIILPACFVYIAKPHPGVDRRPVEAADKIGIGDYRSASMIRYIFRDFTRDKANVQRRDDGTYPSTGKDGLNQRVFVTQHRGDQVAPFDPILNQSPTKLVNPGIKFRIGQLTVIQQVVNRNSVGMEFGSPGDEVANAHFLPF
jgi:hypothetical protein